MTESRKLNVDLRTFATEMKIPEFRPDLIKDRKNINIRNVMLDFSLVTDNLMGKPIAITGDVSRYIPNAKGTVEIAGYLHLVNVNNQQSIYLRHDGAYLIAQGSKDKFISVSERELIVWDATNPNDINMQTSILFQGPKFKKIKMFPNERYLMGLARLRASTALYLFDCKEKTCKIIEKSKLCDDFDILSADQVAILEDDKSLSVNVIDFNKTTWCVTKEIIPLFDAESICVSPNRKFCVMEVRADSLEKPNKFFLYEINEAKEDVYLKRISHQEFSAMGFVALKISSGEKIYAVSPRSEDKSSVPCWKMFDPKKDSFTNLAIPAELKLSVFPSQEKLMFQSADMKSFYVIPSADEMIQEIDESLKTVKSWDKNLNSIITEYAHPFWDKQKNIGNKQTCIDEDDEFNAVMTVRS